VKHLKAYPSCVLVVALLSAFVAASGAAQEERSSSSDQPTLSALKETIGLTGSVRLGYWSATRNLDGRMPIGSAMLWAKTRHDFSPKISVFSESWLASRGPIDHGETKGELREAYLDLKLDRFDLRAGRQIFAWGRADAVNPTANLSGEDLTLLTPDSEDRKLGTTAIRTRYFLPHSVSVSGIWLPEFRPTRFPFPSLGAGTTFVHDIPHWPGDQFAFRAEQTGAAIDWSISYFDGFDLLPDLSVGSDSPSSEQIKVSYHRVRVIGADAAANLGHYALRAEGAYTFTQNSSGRDPFLKEPYFFLILGGDRTYGGELNVNLQYIYRFVANYPPAPAPSDGFSEEVANEEAIIGNQTARVQHGASARISDKWLHETLEGELGIVGYFNPWGILVRPKVTYSFSDHWKAIVGGEVYRGDDRSIFGLLRPNSLGYVETRYSF
jgi:hypothetical protein